MWLWLSKDISSEPVFSPSAKSNPAATSIVFCTSYDSQDILTQPRWALCSQTHLSSVTQSCQTLCDPMDCSTPGLPVHHQLPEPTQTHVHELVMPSNHLILHHPLLLPPSIFLSIRVFSKESALCISWPKHWSFGFSITPSNEYSGLLSFRMN